MFQSPRLLAILAGLALSVISVAGGVIHLAASSLQSGAPWPRFHANNQSTGLGVASGAGGIASVVSANANADYGSPAIGADGTIYVGCGDDNLYALNPDLTIKWSAPAGAAIVATPALGAAYLYTATVDDYIKAYNYSGGPQFSFAAGGSVSSPVIDSDGNIIIATSTGNVYKISGTNGGILWTYSTGTTNIGSPTLGNDGNVYVGTSGGSLFAIDASTGALVWKNTDSNSTAEGSPAVGGDGTVYFCTQFGGLDAINPTTGDSEWKTQYQAGGGPAIGPNGTVYYQGAASLLAVSASNGNLVWSSTVASISELAIAPDGTVMYGDASGSIAAVNGSTGVTNWLYGNPEFVDTAPAIASNGSLYCTDELNHRFIVIGTTQISNFYTASSTTTGGNNVNAVVQITQNAPTGGLPVSIQTNNFDVNNIPSGISIVAGTKGVSFTLGTNKVSSSESATLTVTIEGATKQTTLTLVPASLSGFYFSPNAVVGGQGTRGVVRIGSAAGSGGVVVTLSSPSPNVSVPASVTIPEGATAVSFAVNTTVVNAVTQVNVTATTPNGTTQATITVNPAPIKEVYCSSSNLVGGFPDTCVVELAKGAGPGGDEIQMSCTSPDLQVPATKTVPQGTTGVSFTLTSSEVAATESATITADNGSSSAQTTVTVQPNGVSVVGLSQDIAHGGLSVTGTVYLKLPAQSGTVVHVDMGTLGTTDVSVAAGAESAGFTISTTSVSETTDYTITASLNGTSAKKTLQVLPPSVLYVEKVPFQTGGLPATHTIVLVLSGTAGPSGYMVRLSATSSSVQVPDEVLIPAGFNEMNVDITTTMVGSQTKFTISAFGADGSSKTSAGILYPPPIKQAYALPSSVKSGVTTYGVVQIPSLPGSAAVTVTLSCSDPNISIPATVTIPAGSTGVSFPIMTKAVTTADVVDITATAGSTAEIVLTLNP